MEYTGAFRMVDTETVASKSAPSRNEDGFDFFLDSFRDNYMMQGDRHGVDGYLGLSMPGCVSLWQQASLTSGDRPCIEQSASGDLVVTLKQGSVNVFLLAKPDNALSDDPYRIRQYDAVEGYAVYVEVPDVRLSRSRVHAVPLVPMWNGELTALAVRTPGTLAISQPKSDELTWAGIVAFAKLSHDLYQVRNSWDEEEFAARVLLPALRKYGATLIKEIAKSAMPEMPPMARHYFAFTLGLLDGDMALTARVLLDEYARSDDKFVRTGAIEALEQLDAF